MHFTSSDLPEHPLRQRLAHEVHARPFAGIRSPALISVIGFHTGEEGALAEYQHFCKLCAHYNRPSPPPEGKYFADDFGPFRVKWERHTEFGVFVFIREAEFDHPFDDPVLDLLPQEWLRNVPGKLLIGLHMALETQERSEEEVSRLFDHNSLVSSTVVGGAARVWTDFRLHGDGFGRMLVRDQEGMNVHQAGRLIQRLREIEAYRMMAMLAFPVAQELVPEIKRIDSDLTTIISRMARNGKESDQSLLNELTDLAAQAEQISATTNYRFGAARAYHGLVLERVDEVREGRLEGFQTMAEFVNRRLSPAMRTCESVAGRLEALSTRVARANNLLRTRVDIQMERQSRDHLESMNKRAQLQLRLQETVEGLSLAAITYYAVGLLGYAFKALKEAGVPINVGLATGLAVPLIAGLLWFGLKKVKKKMRKQVEEVE